MTETAQETFARWFKDSDTVVGVFENRDLGHVDLGRRIAFPYRKGQGGALLDGVGKLQAPDSSQGLGWRYLLTEVAFTADAAEAAMQCFACRQEDEDGTA